MKLVYPHCLFHLSLLIAVLFWSTPVYAHASEQGFILLLPTGIYITGGTIAVFASIVLVTVLKTDTLAKLFRPRDFSTKSWPVANAVILCNLISTIALITLIGIGLFGPTDPQGNLLPLVIWTVLWVGIFVTQGVVFDVWHWVNPWVGLHRLMVGNSAPIYHLPTKWAAWPAVALLLMFQIFAVADIAPSDPRRLANVVVGYWIFSFLGMVIFGRDPWLKQVEFFSVLFCLLGRLRVLRKQELGFPGWNAVEHVPLDSSQAIFCLTILATGSFDGLHETFWWLAKININPLEFPGRSAVVWTSTFGLLLASVALVAVFGLAVWIGLKSMPKATNVSFSQAFNGFAVAILPIALGYHFAHFLVSFMVQIQYVLLVLGDPFALGWNLFGLAQTQITTGFLKSPDSVKTIWLTQAGVVVFSHILSVLMAHHVAGVLVKSRKDVVLLQVGLSLLMIAYTVFGLWLLATARGM